MSALRATLLRELPAKERERVSITCFGAALCGHPLFGSRSHLYYESYCGEGYATLDTVVLRNGAPVLFMPLSGHAGRLDYFGGPARAFPVELEDDARPAAHAALGTALREFAAAGYATLDLVEEPALGLPIREASDREIAMVDLTQPEAGIKAGLRKSYKSLVNWGLRHVEATVVDRENPDYGAFLAMRNFHRATAGRATRSDASWDVQFDMILAGEAYAVIGHLDRRLVAASLFLHGPSSAYYGVGIYDRALMAEGRPVGHASVFRGILRARDLGLKTIILGDVTPSGDVKLDQIAQFKRGFASHVAKERHVRAALD